MARRVPRLSWHYECYAEYFFVRGLQEDGTIRCSEEHSIWFYLMAAWFYEDDDEELARQGELPFDGPTLFNDRSNRDD
jgi:hypothetical protein